MAIYCYMATRKNAQVGYPWKEHWKCSSDTLTLGRKDTPVISYGPVSLERSLYHSQKNISKEEADLFNILVQGQRFHFHLFSDGKKENM